MTISSGDIRPLLMPVGEVMMRRASRRIEMFPSVEATKPRPWIQRPAVQISRRCSSSDFSAPGVIGSASMRQGRPIMASRDLPPQNRFPVPRNIREACRLCLSSGIKSAFLQGVGNAFDRQHVGGNSIIDVMNFRVLYHFLEAPFDNIFQTLVDFPFAPEISLTVLDPLEITHRNAAGVGE